MSNWFKKIKDSFSSKKFTDKISSIFIGNKIDEKVLEKFHDLLISSDFGSDTTNLIINKVKKTKFSNEDVEKEVKKIIKSIISNILSEHIRNFEIDKSKLNVILFTGINGSGKTTTIGKLAKKYVEEGLKVKIAACDTFRAAAVNQIEIWAQRANVAIIKPTEKGDPASVAYRAITQSKEDNTNILLIDTAGRLQNNNNLMNELEKIIRVIKKVDPDAPQHSILVLDGTSGQNALSQCESFKKIAQITGLIITKLDGTAKFGILAQITQNFQLPIYFVGLGEKSDDLKKFNLDDYCKSILEI